MKIITKLMRSKRIVTPAIDKQRLVELHPELVYFFPKKEQITILSRLWYQGKLSTALCVGLCPAMDAVIDDIIATCNME